MENKEEHTPTEENFPCQYTVEELREDAARFTERLKRGEVEFISHEEVKKRYPKK